MDTEPVPKHLVGQVGQQLVVLPARPEVIHRLRPGDKSHLRYVGDGFDLAFDVPGLVLGVTLIHIGQELVLRLQLPQHIVQIDRNQSKGAHDEQTGHDHAHGGKGHEAMCKNRVKSFAEIVLYIKFFRHCNTRLSRR